MKFHEWQNYQLKILAQMEAHWSAGFDPLTEEHVIQALDNPEGTEDGPDHEIARGRTLEEAVTRAVGGRDE